MDRTGRDRTSRLKSRFFHAWLLTNDYLGVNWVGRFDLVQPTASLLP